LKYCVFNILNVTDKKVFEKTGGLTASGGVSYNKFLAKVASDFNKPNGLTVVTPDQAATFINQLLIRKFFGVGKVTEEKMLKSGIKNGGDLKKISKQELVRLFGKAGHYFYNIAHGIDNRPVESEWIRKSIGKETTFQEDIDDVDIMIEVLGEIALKLEDLLKKDDRKGRTVTLKVKYFDFQQITRSITVPEPVVDATDIMNYIQKLLANTEAGKKKVRLLGISISNFDNEINKTAKHKQLPLPLKTKHQRPRKNPF